MWFKRLSTHECLAANSNNYMLINRYEIFDNIHKQVKTTTYTYHCSFAFLLVLHYINFAVIFEAYPMPIISMILQQRGVN